MKTLKQHIKEHMQAKYGAGNVGTATSNAVEDGSISALLTYKILMFLKELTHLLVLLPKGNI